VFGNHGLCGLPEEGAPKCLGGNLGDFGGFWGILGDFGGFWGILQRSLFVLSSARRLVLI
ncbi:hypothetical protein, partial [Neisseria meningitidis]|uniref:hypothetical protein n=1 Tax=Neisseria meningitidis TaxID=487 RepID=UPI001C85A871